MTLKATFKVFDIDSDNDRANLIISIRTYELGRMSGVRLVRFPWPICLEDVVTSVMIRTKADEVYYQHSLLYEIPTEEDLFNRM